MTPKEKAEELVYDKYFYHPKLYLSKGAAKLCALIAADEVINTIEFLATERSSGITGQLISVDGGA